MTIKKRNYISLEFISPKNGHRFFICNTPVKAVQALQKIGLAMHWVAVNNIGDGTFVIAYQGWFYRGDDTRELKTPFPMTKSKIPRELENLLLGIFRPFVYEGECITFSTVKVFTIKAIYGPPAYFVSFNFRIDDTKENKFSPILRYFEENSKKNTVIRGKFFQKH